VVRHKIISDMVLVVGYIPPIFNGVVKAIENE